MPTNPEERKAYKAEWYRNNKAALAEKAAQRYQENKEVIIEKASQYYKENKEVIAEKKAQYYEENKEAIAEKGKEYRKNNKEVIAEKKQKYYIENKEAIAEYKTEYREKNKEDIKEKQAEYYQTNKEVIAKKQAEAYQAKKENITYIITVGDYYYIGHTSQGLDTRRHKHLCDIRSDLQDRGSPGLQELYREMGEDAFIKAFDMKKLETFNTKQEAKLAEKKLLNEHVGKKYCLNKQK